MIEREAIGDLLRRLCGMTNINVFSREGSKDVQTVGPASEPGIDWIVVYEVVVNWALGDQRAFAEIMSWFSRKTARMKLIPQFKHVLLWDRLLSIPGSSPQIRRLHAFADGRAVMLVGEFVESQERVQHWFVEITQAGVTAALVPDEVEARLKELQVQQAGADRWEDVDHWQPRSFSVDGRVGLLLSDKWIYVFEGIRQEPLSIQIENPFEKVPSDYRSGDVYFDPIVCGVSSNNSVPVIFRHPDEDYDYACFLSLLEIDVAGRRARWLSKTADGHPIPLIFRPETQVWETPSTVGTFLEHVAWTGGEYLAYSIGSTPRPTYHGMGMNNSVLLRCKLSCEEVALITEEGDSVYGHILSSMDKVVLSPMSRRIRNGKQSLYDLKHNKPLAIELPRGYASYHIFDGGADGLLWSVNDVHRVATDWYALKEGKSSYIAAFSVEE